MANESNSEMVFKDALLCNTEGNDVTSLQISLSNIYKARLKVSLIKGSKFIRGLFHRQEFVRVLAIDIGQ